MKIIIKNKEELEREAVNIIREAIDEILKEKENVVLAVPGGRSVSGIFKLLKKEDIQWQKVHIFMIDERVVPLDHEDSNFKLVKENLLNEEIPEENVHPFILDKGIKDYEEELKKYGSYDIILLSSGEDGHIAALYPKHHSIKDESEFFIAMDDSPKPPPVRMTSSKKLLQRAKVALLLFIGEGKRKAYEKFLDENLTVEECPAKLVKNLNSYILTDLRD